MADRAIADTRSAGLPDVTLFKRAETGSFITNTADGQPGLEVTDGIVNLLCHFIGK